MARPIIAPRGTMHQAAVARFVGVSRQALVKRQAAGKLARRPDGFYSVKEAERWREERKAALRRALKKVGGV